MKFSIVTPNLNQGRFLRECLDSVRSQTKEVSAGLDVEHWVIDGGSTDESLSVLKGYSGIHWISEPDHGQSDALNKGLSRSSGEILAYLCADDFYEQGALGRVQEIFAGRPEVDVVYGDYYFLEGDSGWKRLKRAGAYSVERLKRNNFVGQPAAFWRRGVYEELGGFDTSLKYCMDHEFWLRICEKTHWYYLPVPLACCRLHADSKTGSQLVAMWSEASVMGGKYGVGHRLRFDAWKMKMGGQYYYRAKRWFFERLGRKMNRSAG